MFKKVAVFTVVTGLLLAGAAVYAQDDAGVVDDAQSVVYNVDSAGFDNLQAGRGGAGRGRGQMNRGAGQAGTGVYANLPPASASELPQVVVDLMIAGWMDEQHAYAAYEAIMAQFGDIAPFANIQQSEAQHIAAWELLFERYGIAVPDVPEFDIPQFASVAEACALGAEAEIANFGLYDTMLEAFAEYPDIYQVALTLRNASEFNHLPAFQTCAGL